MKHSIVALSALFAAAQAELILTNTAFGVQPGEPFTVTYNEGGCPAPGCTIELKSGPSTDLKTVKTLTTQATGSSFSFTPAQDWPSGPLAFEIRNVNGERNYSPQFPYTGTGAAAPGSATSSPAGSTATSDSYMTSTQSSASSVTAIATQSSVGRHNSSSITTSRSSSAHNMTTSASRPSSTSIPKEDPVPTVPNSGDRVSASLALAAGVFAALAYPN